LKKKVDLMIALTCGIAAYLLYELTNASGFFWGDGGEFIAVANTLGIGHSYGHPLFWLLGRISIMMTPSNPAAGMNHLVALFSAATCSVVALIALNWCKEKFSILHRMIIVFTVTFIYATAATVWSQASYVEVYNIQAFFIALSLYFLDRYFFQGKRSRDIYASAYFFGTAVTLGLYVLLLLIIPIFMMVIKKIRVSAKVLLISVLFFCAGTSIWIYLFVRSNLGAPLLIQNVDSLKSFIYYIGRKSYAPRGVAGPAALSISLIKTLKILIENIGVWGVLLILFFAADTLFFKKRGGEILYGAGALVLIILYCILIPLNMTFRQMVGMDVYFIPAYICLIPVMSAGASRLMKFLKTRLRFILILPIVIIICARWHVVDISKNSVAEDFRKYLVSNIPESASVLPVSDEVVYPLYYSIFAMNNPKNFNIISATRKDTTSTWWRRYAGRKGVFIEIDDPFLKGISSIDSFMIAGPFFTTIDDSIAAQNLEANFTANFSFVDQDLKLLNVQDRINFGMIWSRRGIFWFHKFKKAAPGSIEAERALRLSLDGLSKAFALDDFSFCGALHASNFALVLVSTGNLDEAEKFAKKAVVINRCSEEAYRTLYGISYRKGDYKRSIYYLKKLSRLRPENGEIHLDMAALYYFTNRAEKAREEYKKGIELGAREREKLRVLLFGKVSSE